MSLGRTSTHLTLPIIPNQCSKLELLSIGLLRLANSTICTIFNVTYYSNSNYVVSLIENGSSSSTKVVNAL